MACFSAAGFVFGTIPGKFCENLKQTKISFYCIIFTGSQIASVPALVACNAQFAKCEAACSTATSWIPI